MITEEPKTHKNVIGADVWPLDVVELHGHRYQLQGDGTWKVIGKVYTVTKGKKR